jgi:lipopolysaccharide export system permease protein
MLTRRDTASRSDREMTIPMMRERQQHYDERMRRVRSRLAESFKRVTGDSLSPSDLEAATARLATYNGMIDQDTLLTAAEKRLKKRRIRSLERQVNNEFRLLESYRKTKNKYSVEIHKKFSLPVACILFVMLGAPLGTLAKKGGFMVAISLGFGFFLVYYVFLIGGEEMADRDIISPAVAMWAPNVIVLIVAGYLTLHTVRERAPVQLSWSSIKRFFWRSSHDSR